MTSITKPLALLLLPIVSLLCTGCQRGIGSMATGPFAPAGSSSASNGSLFPVGPITGATRVPPPPTGSSSSNSYIGTPSATNFNTGPATNMQAASGPAGFIPPDNFNGGAAPMAQMPTAQIGQARNARGGMPVIDLTNQIQPPANNSLAPSFAGAYPAAPVGSGVAYQTPSIAETSAWAQQPADLLRPIDQPFAAVPVPRYRGMENTNIPPSSPYVQPVQPAGGYPANDSWQSVQTQAATNRQPAIGQTSFGPSTDPTGISSPAARTANPSLPWRSPTTAR